MADTITTDERRLVVANFKWMYDHRGVFGYHQDRPFRVRNRAELEDDFKHDRAIEDLDCSAFTITGFFISGLADPSGYNFKGLGSTATMLHFLPHHANAREVLLGALVIFGVGTEEQHVCVVVDHAGTNNPTLISHGQPGVKWLSLDEEQRSHGGETVFLSPPGKR